MQISKEIQTIVRLSRANEYVGSVTIVTALALGLASRSHPLSVWNVGAVLLTNFCAFVFAFMINDIEDSEDDRLDPDKALRNPVSAGHITRQRAYRYTLIMGSISLVIAGLLGWKVLAVDLIVLSLGFLYSWRRVRLKSFPIIDIVSHALFLGTLQFIATVLLVNPEPDIVLVLWGAGSIFCVSLMGDIHNELRDYAVDQTVGLRNTAQLLRLNRYERFLTHAHLIPAVSCLLFLVYVLSTNANALLIILLICTVVAVVAIQLGQELGIATLGCLLIIWRLFF